MSSHSEKGMEYIRVYISILHHWKVEDFVRYLGNHDQPNKRSHVLGDLVTLWLKVGDNFSDGIIRDADPATRVANLSEWEGDPKVWFDGLIKVRLIERHPDGCYIHDWREEHARQWWDRNEKLERTRQLSRVRSKKYYESLKHGKNEAKFLKEKYGIEYDVSPPPPTPSHAPLTSETREIVSHAETPSLTRDKTSDTVRQNFDENLVSKTPQKVTIMRENESPEVVDLQVFDGKTPYSHAVSRTSHVLNHVREENRIEKDKDFADSSEAEPANHQTCVALFLRLFEGKTQQPYQKRKIGHVGVVISRLNETYPHGEIVRRMFFFFESTWKAIQGFRAGAFEENFMALQQGPMLEPDKGGAHDAGFDKPKDIPTVDDFE